MLARISLTPSVMTVNRGTGAGFPSLIYTLHTRSNLEQTELLSIALWLGEMIRRQFGAALVEAEFLAGDLEAAPDHPGHRACPLHPRSPLRVIVATAAHVADQGEDVTIAVGKIRHQPFAE